jgi:hypothetical protein
MSSNSLVGHFCLVAYNSYLEFSGASFENNQFCIVTELLRCSVFDAIVVRKESTVVKDLLRILHQVTATAK